MKRICLHMVTFLLFVANSVFAMGLGGITVHSNLDQPFNAEIELIDVGNIQLSGIKANLASEEDFERVGLERVYALSLLTFNVEKNANGKAVINLRSIERISEPYMQLLVDLAWANGQVYRSYPILLDPPNYRLGQVKKQLKTFVKRLYQSQSPNQTGEDDNVFHDKNTIDNRGAAIYGPTVSNETAWQIAQRYKTENISLQQIILAIVATNPEAFKDGNLNGLKVGSRLRIPLTSTASRVPLTLAKLEVLAHDKAWQSRQPIEHALLPPYIESAAPKAINEQEVSPLGYPLSLSVIPLLPKLFQSTTSSELAPSQLMPLSSSLLSLGEEGAMKQPVQNTTSEPQQINTKTQMNITSAATNLIRDINVLLTEQLRSMQADNKQLHQQLVKRERELIRLRKQVFLILEQQRIEGQRLIAAEAGNGWFWVLLLVVIGAGGCFVYWWRWIRPSEKITATKDISPTEPLNSSLVKNKPLLGETIEKNIKNDDVPVALMTEKIKVNSEVVHLQESQNTESNQQGIQTDEYVFTFEPQIEQVREEIQTIVEPLIEPQTEESHSIEFVLNPVEPSPNAVVDKPVKSKAALETLLALAKTYMSMDDVESAKQSLQEVIEFGNAKQKLEAQRLLDALNKK